MTEPRRPIPRLRFPEFRDAEPWEAKRLGEIADVLQGYGFPDKFQGKTSGKFPFYKVSDISNALASGTHFIDSSANYIDEDALAALRAKTVPSGTTIFAKIGEAIRSNRRVVTTKECVIDNNTAGVKAKGGEGIDLFLFYLFSMINLIEYSGGVVPSVNKTAIENIEVFCPDLPEQQKIADFLGSLDELIRAEAAAVEALRAHKTGLMQQLFPRAGETTPRLRFPEFRDVGPWDMKRLGEVITLEYGSPLPETQRNKGRYPVVGSNGVVGFHDQALIAAPAIVVGRKGSAGEVSWVDSACYPIDTTYYVILRSKDDQLPFVRRLLERHRLTELARPGGVPGLNRDDVYVVKTALPSGPEQQKIADCLASLDDLIHAREARLDALRAHKTGLMQQLFPQKEG